MASKNRAHVAMPVRCQRNTLFVMPERLTMAAGGCSAAAGHTQWFCFFNQVCIHFDSIEVGEGRGRKACHLFIWIFPYIFSCIWFSLGSRIHTGVLISPSLPLQFLPTTNSIVKTESEGT